MSRGKYLSLEKRGNLKQLDRFYKRSIHPKATNRYSTNGMLWPEGPHRLAIEFLKGHKLI